MADSTRIIDVLDTCGCETVQNASAARMVADMDMATYQKRVYNGLVNPDDVCVVNNTDGSKDAGGHRIVNVGNPVAASDATNKQYVDKTIACKLACSSGLARDNKKRIDFLEPSYNNLAKRFQYLDKKYYYLVQKYSTFQGELHDHANKENVLDLLVPSHVGLIGGDEGDVTYHNGDAAKTVSFKHIMNLNVHICTSQEEVEECKQICLSDHSITEGHKIIYIPDDYKNVQIWYRDGNTWKVQSASYPTVNAAYNAITDVIGAGRYCYNPITGRFFWCDSRKVPIRELDFNAFYIGRTPPQNKNLLWLFPEEDAEYASPTRLDNLQYQIYKLGLQVKDLSRVMEAGCIPGDIDCNYKNELIEYGEMLKPEEIEDSNGLYGVSIYGKKNCQNGDRYYVLFNPSGFNYLGDTESEDNKNPTKLKWSFENCDKTTTGIDIPHQKTIEYTEGSGDSAINYKLRLTLERVNEVANEPLENYKGTGTSHLCFKVNYATLRQGYWETLDQTSIDTIIRYLADKKDSAGKNISDFTINIETDKYSEELEDYVTGSSPTLTLTAGAATEDNSDCQISATISGPQYFDDGTNYYVVFNSNVEGETDKHLHSNCHWFFKNEQNEKVNTVAFYKPIKDIEGNVISYDTSVVTHTVTILNPNSPIATMSVVVANGYYLKDLPTQSLELHVESVIDTTINAKMDVEIGGIKPITVDYEPTVHCVCAKVGKQNDFAEYAATLHDGEIIYYTDQNKFVIFYKGEFKTLTGGSSSTTNNNGITINDLLSLKLPYLNFSHGTDYFRLYVDDKGKVHTLRYDDSTKQQSVESDLEEWGVYVSHNLSINSIYCGGSNVSYKKCCSHSFVELANSADYDINLNGLYLLYSDSKDTSNAKGVRKWETLKLQGIIKSGGTFLIRGACCNPYKDALIKVDTYDMEWYQKSDVDTDYDRTETDYERTGPLMKFSQDNCSFYLVYGYSNLDFVKNEKTPYVANVAPNGYVDLCGFKSSTSTALDADVPAETGVLKIPTNFDNTLLVRYFSMDPSKQANKAYASRKTTDLWTYIDLTRQTRKQGNNTQYYYPDYLKVRFTPKASYEFKSFFTNKTCFRNDKPNMVNITFGRQATETVDENNIGQSNAGRCFNWVSVGYYDEYVEYKKTTDSDWTRVYSITADTIDTVYIKGTSFDFHPFYDRYRWTASDGTFVTTHKCLIHGLSAGNYQYRIGRDDDENYISETFTFKVRNDLQVQSFKFIQTTDQQGFNWLEYQAWKRSCDMIAKIEKNGNEFDFDFTINTGDATQSGNRINEWLDYYDGRKSIRGLEEMYTVGNNDLCGEISTNLTNGEDATSKYNQINSFRYFCFELDPNNADNLFCEFTESVNGAYKYPIYSLYSFNYGKYHFVCLNSEISKYYGQSYGLVGGNENLTKQLNGKIEDWFKKDLQLFKGVDSSTDPYDCGKCIVYMHEMPFTIVTYDWMANNGTEDTEGTRRSNGCKLNDWSSKGDFRFSRLFKKYGIKLVIGGHKHTFSISKPIYDAPAEYLTNNTGDETKLMNAITTTDSRKPIIQVLNASDIPDSTSVYHKYARYEVVNKITAPTYVMCQATGYKLVSNKELPAFDLDIPWLLSYYKATKKSETNLTAVENSRQHRPTYIKYELNDDGVLLTVKQVDNVWVTTATSKKYDINQPKDQVYVVPMTFSVPDTFTNKPSTNVPDDYNPTIIKTGWEQTANTLKVDVQNAGSYDGRTSYKISTSLNI